MGTGSGFGKVILFNEHFVVYGIPAIASAIDSKTEATVERLDDAANHHPSGNEGSMAGDGWVLEDDRPANPDYKATKIDHQKESIELVFKAAAFDPKVHNIKITLAGDLKAIGGVGASAAVCVSLARALNDEFALGFDGDKINEIAYEGEKAYAGNPSGIDNTASTYGGLLSFQKNPDGGENRIELIKTREPVRIVMGNTGITANTKAAVDGVKERKEQQPDKYNRIFNESRALVQQARAVIDSHNLDELGKLMNKNHQLLQEIEVSHPKLDELVEISLANGALGAKMTGGGMGGYMVALTPTEEIQNRVVAAMQDAGYEGFKRTIGV